MSKIEVNEIVKSSGSTLTIGGCGTTVTLGSGATQSGFGRSGSVNWQTGSIKTTTFTATSGEGYFVDTSSGAVTANLPAGSAGAIVSFSDYTRTFNNNNLTISPNGSNKIGGVAGDVRLNVNGQAATFVYVDGTEGWINVQETQTSQTGTTGFIMATGGTITESGNCRVHTFTSPGTFQVNFAANTSACNQISYMVVAGGGGSGGSTHHIAGGGAGGAGGFREDKSPITPYTASPLDGAGDISVTAQSYPITVGAGGTAGTKAAGGAFPNPNVSATNGSDSVFSTITSAGGGKGGQGNPGCAPKKPGGNGGSGGGGGGNGGSAGSGNTPPVSPSQGNNGSPGAPGGAVLGGAGGGATGVGGCQTDPGFSPTTPTRGAGATTSINFSPTTFATGGRANCYSNPAPSAISSVGNATANTGNGACGQNMANPAPNMPQATFDGVNGGSGIVIIRYKYQ